MPPRNYKMIATKPRCRIYFVRSYNELYLRCPPEACVIWDKGENDHNPIGFIIDVLYIPRYENPTTKN
jgi:hypothetical protein